jgi:hypothetical protein
VRLPAPTPAPPAPPPPPTRSRRAPTRTLPELPADPARREELAEKFQQVAQAQAGLACFAERKPFPLPVALVLALALSAPLGVVAAAVGAALFWAKGETMAGLVVLTILAVLAGGTWLLTRLPWYRRLLLGFFGVGVLAGVAAWLVIFLFGFGLAGLASGLAVTVAVTGLLHSRYHRDRQHAEAALNARVQETAAAFPTEVDRLGGPAALYDRETVAAVLRQFDEGAPPE